MERVAQAGAVWGLRPANTESRMHNRPLSTLAYPDTDQR
jgi:hypothetical protein